MRTLAQMVLIVTPGLVLAAFIGRWMIGSSLYDRMPAAGRQMTTPQQQSRWEESIRPKVRRKATVVSRVVLAVGATAFIAAAVYLAIAAGS